MLTDNGISYSYSKTSKFGACLQPSLVLNLFFCVDGLLYGARVKQGGFMHPAPAERRYWLVPVACG